jgi:23S rRNA (adenine2030-N6)-methyltransferase
VNYRHAYHAGNFADVVKHVVLSRLVEYLKQKDKAFRVIDTHAGIGRYDLSSTEAQKTGEWRGGIGRLVDAALDPPAAALLAPYLEAVRSLNPQGGVKKYPGSPLIVRHLMRKQDRLSAIELHRQDAGKLRTLFQGDFQTRVIELDGWLALGAHLPPKEKRGLVLVDPPFEEQGEFDRLVDGLRKAHKRWQGGIYALWYPVKDRKAVAAFRKALVQSASRSCSTSASRSGRHRPNPALTAAAWWWSIRRSRWKVSCGGCCRPCTNCLSLKSHRTGRWSGWRHRAAEVSTCLPWSKQFQTRKPSSLQPLDRARANPHSARNRP